MKKEKNLNKIKWDIQFFADENNYKIAKTKSQKNKEVSQAIKHNLNKNTFVLNVAKRLADK